MKQVLINVSAGRIEALTETEVATARTVNGVTRLVIDGDPEYWYMGTNIKRGSAPNGYFNSWRTLNRGASSMAECKQMIEAREKA